MDDMMMMNMTNMTGHNNMTGHHNMTEHNMGHNNSTTEHANSGEHNNGGGHSGHGGGGGTNNLVDGGSDDDPFCFPSVGHGLGTSSDGMIMYMDGFRFSLKGEQQCLNLYFPGWTLDSRGKFAGAMIGVFAMAVLTEGVAKWRFVSNKKLKGSPKRRLFITLLHTLQAMLGYVLMLATMTFSVELLLMVVFGLGTGYAVFYDDSDKHVTTNPCCNFMQNEADERAMAFPSSRDDLGNNTDNKTRHSAPMSSSEESSGELARNHANVAVPTGESDPEQAQEE